MYKQICIPLQKPLFSESIQICLRTIYLIRSKINKYSFLHLPGMVSSQNKSENNSRPLWSSCLLVLGLQRQELVVLFNSWLLLISFFAANFCFFYSFFLNFFSNLLSSISGFAFLAGLYKCSACLFPCRWESKLSFKSLLWQTEHE